MGVGRVKVTYFNWNGSLTKKNHYNLPALIFLELYEQIYH